MLNVSNWVFYLIELNPDLERKEMDKTIDAEVEIVLSELFDNVVTNSQEEPMVITIDEIVLREEKLKTKNSSNVNTDVLPNTQSENQQPMVVSVDEADFKGKLPSTNNDDVDIEANTARSVSISNHVEVRTIPGRESSKNNQEEGETTTEKMDEEESFGGSHIEQQKMDAEKDIDGESAREKCFRHFCSPFELVGCNGNSDEPMLAFLKYYLFRLGNYGMGAWKAGTVSGDVILTNLTKE